MPGCLLAVGSAEKQEIDIWKEGKASVSETMEPAVVGIEDLVPDLKSFI